MNWLKNCVKWLRNLAVKVIITLLIASLVTALIAAIVGSAIFATASFVTALKVIITLLIVVIVGSAIAAWGLSGKYKRRKTTSTTTSTKSSGWFWKLVIVGVIGIGIVGIIRYRMQQPMPVGNIVKFQSPRKQQPGEEIFSVYSPTNSWSEPVNVGLREFKLHLGAPSFIKRNGVPILDKTSNLVIFLPQGKERLGDGIKTLEFKSLGTNATHEIAVKSW